ncbi:MAG: metallophosphoesterase [Bacteroidales bacterium]|nr:metallophosphoesterase [Bacteroidales bacterium]
METRKAYFASDFHLGLAAGTDPHEREQRVIAWLDRVSADAESVWLLGDVFDFWWEYRKVIPKGFTRFLGRLASLTDSGIKVHVFTGNHDMWMKGYLAEECGVTVHYEPSSQPSEESCFIWPMAKDSEAEGSGRGCSSACSGTGSRVFSSLPSTRGGEWL